MGCCGNNNSRKTKDWGSSHDGPRSKRNLLPITLGVLVLGFIIYRFII